MVSEQTITHASQSGCVATPCRVKAKGCIECLNANRNFDSDSDTRADKQGSRQNQNLTKLEQKLAAAEKETAAKHSAPRP